MDDRLRTDDTMHFAKTVMHEVNQGKIDRTRVLVALVMLHGKVESKMKELSQLRKASARSYAEPVRPAEAAPDRRGNIYRLPVRKSVVGASL